MHSPEGGSRRQAHTLFLGPLCIWTTLWKVFPTLLGCPTQLILPGTAFTDGPETGLLVDSRSHRVDRINTTYPPTHAWPVGVG